MPPPTRHAALAVALGGAAGATCRWALGTTLAASSADGIAWPWATLTANVVGCLLLGIVVTRVPFATPRNRAVVVWRDGLGTGFCGGLTTFSTFSVEAAEMLRADRAMLAAAYLAVSLLTGCAAFVMARRVAHAQLARRGTRPRVAT